MKLESVILDPGLSCSGAQWKTKALTGPQKYPNCEMDCQVSFVELDSHTALDQTRRLAQSP